jgi:hypothetical protein
VGYVLDTSVTELLGSPGPSAEICHFRNKTCLGASGAEFGREIKGMCASLCDVDDVIDEGVEIIGTADWPDCVETCRTVMNFARLVAPPGPAAGLLRGVSGCEFQFG